MSLHVTSDRHSDVIILLQISNKRGGVYSSGGFCYGNMVLLFDWSDCSVQNNCDWRHYLRSKAQHFRQKVGSP